MIVINLKNHPSKDYSKEHSNVLDASLPASSLVDSMVKIVTTMTVRNPASRKHIEQFKEPKFFLIEETPELYEEVTLPVIKKKPKKHKKWIYDILEGKAEVDRVIFNDNDEKTGFVLIKDSDWLDDDKENLNLLAIARNDLKSIRELNGTHLPLLKNIKEAGSKAIKEKYGIPAENLRICFHYLPSSYHLHVHFAHFTADNTERVVDRIHLLARVINNIELMPDYYQKATLTIRHCKDKTYKPYQDYLKKKKAT
ncbi:m7GpppX diphosphatase-like isoform X2 [Microplitis mediator]|uniref:m7GpppX diphosphatase-like isoform X2 n=2 Tax=Microplitis mediator TaxID=375433 RepID=UPI0025550EDF|nr:m7GpppX diphosphatase-like isoform X2 [Microplitis mediator]